MNSDYIELRDGPTLPASAINLACGLEALGHVLGVRNGKLTVSDGSKLADTDRAAIHKWRLHLMALVDYCEKGVEPL